MPAQQRPASTNSPRNDSISANKPVHTVRHRRLKATIWKNETSNGLIYNVTILRSYRDDSGEWKDTGSIGYDDLMHVAGLMYEAHAFISDLRARENAARNQSKRRGS